MKILPRPSSGGRAPSRAPTRPLLALAAVLVAGAGTLAPRAAEAQQLFPARNVFTSAPGTVAYATRTVRFRCRPGDVAAIVSPGNPSGVIVDNFLTYDGNNLCPGGGGNSCFSQNFSVVPGTPANTAYQGVGSVSFTPTTGFHTFRLVDAGVIGANNRLVLRTSCRVKILRNPRPGSTGSN